MSTNEIGKHYDKLQIINMNARMYDPILGEFISVDPLADKYPGWGPYVYCVNNPLSNWDPTGEYTVVQALEDGTYSVIGGSVEGDDDDDLSIYVADEDGNRTDETIGESLTSHSFVNDEGEFVKGAIIDPITTEGQDFLNDLKESNPKLTEYMKKAQYGEFNKEGDRNIYNFKDQGISDCSPLTKEQYQYRGSRFKDGVFASARDFGNYGAGFVAGRKGIGIIPTRIAFDVYESKKAGTLSFEGPTTRKAENKGYWDGLKTHFTDYFKGK